MPAQKLISLFLLFSLLLSPSADAGRKKHKTPDDIRARITRLVYPPTAREDPWLRRAVGAGRLHAGGEALQMGVRYATSAGFLSQEWEKTFERGNLYLLGLATLFHYAAFIPTPQEERSRFSPTHKKYILFLLMLVHAFADFIEASNYAGTPFKEGTFDPSRAAFSLFTLILWNEFAQGEIRRK